MTQLRSGRALTLAKQLRRLCPLISKADFDAVMAVAAAGHLRHLPPSVALWQGLTSHIRHAYTEYDALLADGYDRDSARHFVTEAMNEVLDRWGCPRRVEADEP